LRIPFNGKPAQNIGRAEANQNCFKSFRDLAGQEPLFPAKLLFAFIEAGLPIFR
jgi:hypothetical protein